MFSESRTTTDLGKYIDIPFLHKSMNKNTFSGIIANIQSKLNGWKSRLLNVAGRVTLTRSVISAIPTHSMSTVLLPASTCDAIDRICGNFIRGTAIGQRCIHLVNWDTVCKPHSEGGLNVRTARKANTTLIGKLGWKVLTKRDPLRIRLFLAKYKIGIGDPHDICIARKACSPTWCSILKGLHVVVLSGCGCNVFNGKNVNFWKDRWASDKTLVWQATRDIPELETSWWVVDL
ncbi:hypothetical protein V2J09_022350 [Rumex salicifolius]